MAFFVKKTRFFINLPLRYQRSLLGVFNKKLRNETIQPITKLEALHCALLPMIRVKQELSNAGIYLGQRLGT